MEEEKDGEENKIMNQSSLNTVKSMLISIWGIKVTD